MIKAVHNIMIEEPARTQQAGMRQKIKQVVVGLYIMHRR